MCYQPALKPVTTTGYRTPVLFTFNSMSFSVYSSFQSTTQEELNYRRTRSREFNMFISALWIYAAMWMGVACGMILTPITSQHEDSIAISGPMQTSRSLIEAAMHCQRTQNCRGFWFDDDHSDLVSQTGLCPTEPSTLNDGLKQNGFYFIAKDSITKGDYSRKRCIPLAKANDADLWCFLWSAPD